MRIAFRVDASVRMGLGHLRRCLSLAEALAESGASILFVTRPLGVDGAAEIAAAGFELRVLIPPPCPFQPEADLPAHAGWAEVGWEADAAETLTILASDPPDIVVVDHYAFDVRWHDRLRAGLHARIVAIDDLGDRPLGADVVVDPTPQSGTADKHGGGGPSARILAGPRFAMLSSAYRERRPFAVGASVNSIGIFMGGSDIANSTEIAWRAMRLACGPEMDVHVAATSANPHLDRLRIVAREDPHCRLVVDSPDLAGFFAAHDLQVGAGGGSSWERCCIGVPSILVAFAENQEALVRALEEMGVAAFVEGGASDVRKLAAGIAKLAADPEARLAISRRARALVDGRGCQRIAAALIPVALRPADDSDAMLAFAWRNHPDTRRFFTDPRQIGREEHVKWWRSAVASPDRSLFIAHAGSLALGVLRLDRDGDEAEMSIYVDPDLAGLGVGSKMIKAGVDWAAGHGGIERLTARILPGNLASRAAFGAAGFRADGDGWSRTVVT